MATLHFWLPSRSPFAVEGWDPDREPNRSSSSVSHSLIELYKRLEARGVSVSMGNEIESGTRLLVVLARTVSKRPVFSATLRALRQVDGRFVLLQTDTDPWRKLPVRPTIEVVPNRAAVREPWQRWVPELPQRGIRPRRQDRKGRIQAVTFKGNPLNVHPVLSTDEWRHELERRGLEWSLDVPTEQEGTDHRWPDYSDVDAVLCVRHPRWDGLLARKPAGKLINAWLAGCIPFAAREPAYVELGTDGKDVFFVDSPWDCLSIVEQLNGDPTRLAEVESAIAERAVEFAPACVVDLWQALLFEAASSSLARNTLPRRVVLRTAQVKVDAGLTETTLGRLVAGSKRRLTFQRSRGSA
jgi:hypothetical protein